MNQNNQPFSRVVWLAGWLFMVGCAWLGLAACSDDEAAEEPPPVSVPTRTLAPPSATPTLPSDMTTPTPTDLPGPATLIPASSSVDAGGLIPESAQALIDMIADELLSSDVRDDVRVLSLERFVWHDAAWGCKARRAEGYTDEGTVPGYRIIFTTGTRAYVYHTDRQETFFRCEDQDWLGLQGEALPLDPIAESMVVMSARAATRRLDVAESDLEVVGLLVIAWPDSSVGCPKPGAEYDDQETAGYRIVFRVGDTSEPLIYHTSLHHVVRCTPEEEILPGYLRRALPASSPQEPDSTPEATTPDT
jgi:hypothetical protein